METWTGGARQLDPSWTGNIATATSVLTRQIAIAGGPHLEMAYEWFPTKWPQSSGKIAGMFLLLTLFLRHCIVVRASGSFFFFFFHLQDRWWQVIWVQAGGGVVGEERGRMVNSSVSRLCIQTGVVVVDLMSQVAPKSHGPSRDSVFILKHAKDSTGRMFIKPRPLRTKW